MEKIILNKIVLVFLLLNTCFLVAQSVGINTSNPSARLDIASNDNITPNLLIEPQLNPVGSNNGDLSVIGDKLYKYDANRTKWLSIESSIYNFAEDENSEVRLEYTGDIEITGPIIPMNATIVSVSINCAGGTLNKGVRILINGVDLPNNDTLPNEDGLINMIGYSYRNNNYNIDLNANDTIMVRLEDNGTTVNDIKVELILKWRK